jgi:hypothetical protein
MATTIIISTNVKPDLREVLLFIFVFCFFCFAAGLTQQADYMEFEFRSLIAHRDRSPKKAAFAVPVLTYNDTLQPLDTNDPARRT